MSLVTEAHGSDGRKLSRSGELFAYNSPSTLILVYADEDYRREYSIVDTDYDSYAIVHNCKLDDAIQESGAVLSRTATVTPEVEAAVNRELSKLGIRRELFREIDQSNCN